MQTGVQKHIDKRPNPFIMSRMDRLIEWLASTKTTQLQLSERSGIPQPLISKYVTGKQRPNIDNALAIERATDGEVPVEAWELKKDVAA